MGIIREPGCCEGWESLESDVNGECPECGSQTVDGVAASGCSHSPSVCVMSAAAVRAMVHVKHARNDNQDAWALVALIRYEQLQARTEECTSAQQCWFF